MTRTEILLNNQLFKMQSENSTVLAIEIRGRYLKNQKNCTWFVENRKNFVDRRQTHLDAVADLKPLMEFRKWTLYEVVPLIDNTSIISHEEFSKSVVNFVEAISKQKETMLVELQFFHYEKTNQGIDVANGVDLTQKYRRSKRPYVFNPLAVFGKSVKFKEKIGVNHKMKGKEPYELNFATIPMGGWKNREQQLYSQMGFEVPANYTINATISEQLDQQALIEDFQEEEPAEEEIADFETEASENESSE